MTSTLVKSLSRLSRPTLIDLALHWLDKHASCAPYLASNRTIAESDEEDYLFPPAHSIGELRSIWKTLKVDEDAGSKQHVIDRIVDGDWRRGLTLYQHATIDFAYLTANDTALRWTALRLTPLESSSSLTAGASGEASEPPVAKKRKTSHGTAPQVSYPTISPSTFLQTLKASLSPLLKATYHLTTLSISPNQRLPVLRLYLSPNTAFAPRSSNIPRSARHATDTGRVMYIALPQSCPYVYVSLAGASASAASSTARGSAGAASNAKTQAQQTKMDVTTMKRLVIEAIPKALSRAHERWALEGTKLTCRGLSALGALRSGGRPGTAGGAYAVLHAEGAGKEAAEPSPVDVAARSYPSPPPEGDGEADGEEANAMFFPDKASGATEDSERASRKRKAEVDVRFGPQDQVKRARLDRVTARIADVCRPRGEGRGVVDAAPVSVTFCGADVHGGLRALAELGVLDLQCMPGWVAGEEGQSVISV
ncbi:uncharacterized protein HMPREF1541_02766 [Cyphellophora europaea CBS 101466]|uniref:CHL4 family chromosome segregation protein n=1 Tax=Cyphellophora europaea (strain CBS 101466) TaxID=1220924 RepID=W2S4J0_CYPE1|nr:uncharacterized protein HMPREF1541_02766 [Cyphellophora europaea CBS 101466]ETN43607.1 hypothetical protein HMPREF1541_02766 [Cyphellophora europaea CBS 101466]